MDSIIQEEKECFACGTTQYLQLHHCLHGTANRKLADRFGLVVWLCRDCHLGRNGVHFNKGFDDYLKRLAQEHWEAKFGTREGFRAIFGKSYL